MNQISKVEEESGGGLLAQLDKRAGGWSESLPAHIPVERFKRVVETAIKNNPKLAAADRLSLWNSCMRAAQDGLLPDGRDGALVIYSTKKGSDWIDMVQWMPMVAGIRKKVRNSGEISTWDVNVVYARDQFEFELGDDPYIKHRPFMAGDPGPMIAVYSVATLKGGEKSRDVMTRAQVEYVRDTFSKRNRDGKFSPAWEKTFDEMAKKTVVRRHSKVLPMSTDLDDLIRRDDALYDLEGKGDKKVAPRVGGPRSLDERLDALAGTSAKAIDHIDVTPTHDAETGEIINSNSGEPHSPEASAPAHADDGAGASVSLASTEALVSDQSKAAPETAQKVAGGKVAAKATKTAVNSDILPRANDAASRGRESLDAFLDTVTSGDELAALQPELKRLRDVARAADAQIEAEERAGG